MKFLTLIVPLLVAGFVAPASAQKAEFRGMEFGKPLPLKQFTQIEDDGGDLRVYTRKVEKMKIGPYRLKQVAYGTWKNEFLSVVVMAQGSTDCDGIKSVLRSKYGEPDEENQFSGDTVWSSYTDATLIQYEMNQFTDACKVVIGHAPTYMKMEADKKAAADAAVGDL